MCLLDVGVGLKTCCLQEAVDQGNLGKQAVERHRRKIYMKMIPSNNTRELTSGPLLKVAFHDRGLLLFSLDVVTDRSSYLLQRRL